ncbi:MAG: hypothetical protein IPG09_03515 [Ignavibacteria bacterium]|nr:hypothetical protein [Ignavibacteria bacterium]
MAQDLETWLENYEPYFGHRFIVKTIKALHADLAKQLEYEQQFLTNLKRKMKTILPNYDPKVSQPFSFKISTSKESTVQAAENLFQLLGVSSGKKDHLKKRFIATLLLNLKLSLYNENMIAISLRPAHYAKQHKRYRQAIKPTIPLKKLYMRWQLMGLYK